MGEEKKENKDSKKLKYEVPRLFKIGDVKAKGDCRPGNSDIGTCYAGGAALDICSANGSSAISACISTGGQNGGE
jgi:hypothetical protein